LHRFAKVLPVHGLTDLLKQATLARPIVPWIHNLGVNLLLDRGGMIESAYSKRPMDSLMSGACSRLAAPLESDALQRIEKVRGGLVNVPEAVPLVEGG
jgi:hypothetical protein